MDKDKQKNSTVKPKTTQLKLVVNKPKVIGQLEYLEKIKTLAVVSMFSDDELMNKLVLKGGNAIDLFYNISERASIDIDFSIESEFDESELESIEKKIHNVLVDTFLSEGFKVFDIKFFKKPSAVKEKVKKFWGGYGVEFKVIPKEVFDENQDDIEFLRRNASVVGPQQIRIFKLDISKFEYCKDKKKEDLEGYTVYVYSPRMLVIEKIRAICQQMPEYKEVIDTLTISPRPRDFFDIFNLIERYKIDLNSDENKEMLIEMFKIKEVPIILIKKIEKYRDFHKEGFFALKDTVKPSVELKDFDFYFDYVVQKTNSLEV